MRRDEVMVSSRTLDWVWQKYIVPPSVGAAVIWGLPAAVDHTVSVVASSQDNEDHK